MEPTELAAVITAIAGLLGALGVRAWFIGRRRPEEAAPLLDKATAEDQHSETRALVRELHQEARIHQKEVRSDIRDVHDMLVRIEAKADARSQ